MKKERIDSTTNFHPGYGAGSGDTERIEYKCPCGRGKIIEEHDNIPGFREHEIYFECDNCSRLFDINNFQGRSWVLNGFMIKGLTNSKLRLDDTIETKDITGCLINLFEFLSWAFSIREKCKIKKEDSPLFYALKDVLDLLKHDYDLIKLNFLAVESQPGYSYPRKYPYMYTTKIVFGCIDSLPKIGSARLERYKINLEGKSVKQITKEIFDDTIELYNNYEK